MTTSTSTDQESVRLRVSVLTRLLPTLAHALPLLGAGLSAFLLHGVVQAMKYAETAGVGAVAVGMVESNVPVLIGLYLAIACGVAAIILVVVRLLMATATASPPGWFFLMAGSLALIPLALLWEAESILIQAVAVHNIVPVAFTLEFLFVLIMILAPLFVVVLLAISLLPTYLSARPRFGPIVIMLLIELILVAAAVFFQLRTSWLHQAGLLERM